MLPSIGHDRRRWFQFRLRGLLVLVTIVGICLALVVRWHDRAVRQREAVAALMAESFTSVGYENDVDPVNDPVRVPTCLAGVLDFDHFYDVVSLQLSDTTDVQLQCLQDLPAVERLTLFAPSGFTANGIRHIRSLRSLRSLSVRESPAVNDGALAVVGLIERLTHVEIECGNCVTDAGLAELRGLSRLEALTIRCGWNVSDAGLAQLGALSRLESLELDLDDLTNGADVYLPAHAGPLSGAVTIGGPRRGRDLSWLRNLKRLNRLRVAGGDFADPHTVSHLSGMSRLAALELVGERGLTDRLMADFRRLRALDSLVLNCPRGEETDDGWAYFADVPHLRTLEIHPGPNTSDAGLAKLNACADLTRLKLHLNDRLTGAGLARLERLAAR